MNVLTCYPAPDVRHGSEIAMHRGVRALQERGHRVFLAHAMLQAPLTAANYDGSLSCPDVFDRRSKLPPAGVRSDEQRLLEFVRANEIGVVHFHGYPRSASLVRIARRCATVTTAHVPLCPNGARFRYGERACCERKIGLGCWRGYLQSGCGQLVNGQSIGPLPFLRGFVEDRVLHRAIGASSAIVVPSKWMRRRLVLDGLPEDRVHVLHPAIDDGSAESVGDPIVRRESSPAILFVGQLTGFKGPDDLLRASARLHREHQLWFAGDGPMRSGLERIASDLGITGRVTFLGPMESAGLNQLRRKSAIAAVTSVGPETFCMVGPEAMRLGVPVVAYNSGGIGDWLIDNETGKLVPQGDVHALATALESLLADSELRAKMGAAAQRAADAWSLSHHGERLEAIYEEVIRLATPAQRRSDCRRIVCGSVQ